MSGGGRQLGTWLPPVLFVTLAFSLYAAAGTDDSYLTYWAAHTLSSSGEFLNYNGARIEQSSSLLHVLTLAVLHRVTSLSLPTLGVLIGLTCGALTVAMTQRLAGLIDQRLSLPAGFLIALSTPVLYWSMGGLETTMAAAGVIESASCSTARRGGCPRALPSCRLRWLRPRLRCATGWLVP